MGETEHKSDNNATTAPRRPLWLRVLKPLAITAATLVGLLLLVSIVAAWVLTPERLTALVRKYGTEYLVDGRVDVERVDLTWWSTFPRIELTVDRLAVSSLSADIPAEGRTLLAVERLSGALELSGLALGRIDVRDVEITRPQVTVYTAASGASNLDILPPSEPKTDEESGPVEIPPLSINRFVIDGDAPLRYVSEPDSTSVELTLHRVQLSDEGVPVYSVLTRGRLGVGGITLPDSMRLSLDGRVAWQPEQPLAVGLEHFTLGADSIAVTVDAVADFSGADPTVESLAVELQRTPLEYLLRMLRSVAPEQAAEIPADLTTGMTLEARGSLRAPYTPAVNPLPAMDAEVVLTDGALSVKSMGLDFKNIGVTVGMTVDADSLSASVVEVRRLVAEGARGGIKVDFTGSVTDLLTDPLAEGCFKGQVDFRRLPPRLFKALGMSMQGVLDADVDFRLRQSHLSQRTFHLARVTGEADLRRFVLRADSDSLLARTGHARLHFGTSDCFVAQDGRQSDSLLAVSLSLDSLCMDMPGMSVKLADTRMGLACRNDAQLSDTSVITPMGGRMAIESVWYHSEADTIHATMRGVKAGFNLRRYASLARVPSIGAGLEVRRLMWSDAENRLTLRNGLISAVAQMNPPAAKRGEHRGAGRRARTDSVAHGRHAAREGEYLDMSVDRTTAALLRRWNVNGQVMATAGRMFTPVFPLPIRLADLDFKFTTDSLSLRDLKLNVGRSDFRARGSVKNLRRVLMGRRRTPLKVNFTLTADTINVNELTRAAFRGAAYAARRDSLAANDAALDLTGLTDEELQQHTDSISTEQIAALLVPRNLVADLRFSARNIVYSTMLMHGFTGHVLVSDGAVSLTDMAASTDIGSLEFNALYSAPTRSDINMAMGLELRRFHIDGVTKLMPMLDTLMPILGTISGVVNVGLGATAAIDSGMNVVTPSLRAMMTMSGDSLVLLDPETFHTVSRWLLFRDKKKNMIDHMAVQLAVKNSMLELYPFMFDFDRYRLGVMGHNDLSLNLDYHISVLRSPVPFKFGINIKGSADKMKIRLGRARFKENMAGSQLALTDSVRINLVEEMRRVFSRGASAARVGPLEPVPVAAASAVADEGDTISAADSLFFIREGLIELPADSVTPHPTEAK